MSTVKLYVKHGKSTHDITADSSTLVSDVMQQIQQVTGVLTRDQKLVCQGKVLLPNSTLEALKVKTGSKLMLLAGGSQTQVPPDALSQGVDTLGPMAYTKPKQGRKKLLHWPFSRVKLLRN